MEQLLPEVQEFLRTVTEVEQDDANQVLALLREKQIPCGYFYPFADMLEQIQYLDMLEEQGLQIAAICNLNPQLAAEAREKYGRDIVSLREFQEQSRQIGVMIMHPLLNLGAYGRIFEAMQLPTLFLGSVDSSAACKETFFDHLPEIYAAYADFHDDDSRAAFLGGWRGRITARWSQFHFAPEPQYLLAGFMPQAGDIAIDGGAYDGGTSAMFASLGAEVYAFEMDAKNYQKCQARAEAGHFTVENLGLSDRPKEASYNSSGTGSSLKEEGSDIAHCTSIDAYVEQKQLPRVDYIKLDVEGAELDTLHGAVQTIAKWKPRLAISAYHKDEDIYRLQAYIKSIRPDYEFAFRHYEIDVHDYWLSDGEKAAMREYNLGESVPTPCEMILYAR